MVISTIVKASLVEATYDPNKVKYKGVFYTVLSRSDDFVILEPIEDEWLDDLFRGLHDD